VDHEDRVVIRIADAARGHLARVEEILFELSALPETERAQAAARLCAGEPALHSDVMSLLAHAARVGDFLEEPALGKAFTLLPVGDDSVGQEDDMIGRTVGRFRLERRLGSGGMGVVYRAARSDGEFAQLVALKIVKRGMDTEEILQRFRRERQTLAALEHPNIARLVDGGATESGQPYLVMEFVEGEPIDAYCDHHQLGLSERIRLFLTVCDAVQFAHRHLVVHRDLKPGNILVARDGTPKLLDFGIARVVGEDAQRQVTVAGARHFTPEYASPEQIAGKLATTTSDVYSLGVILYELLTGTPPYRFTTRTAAEIQHTVAEALPRLPSEAVLRAAGSEDGESAARRRGGSVDRLARRLRGDIDTIVLCALRKEPERRYASVEHLASDLRRHLDRLPVSARRDTLTYRAGKFVQRHVLATSLAVLSALFLVVGGAAVAWQAELARAERDRARDDRAVALSARAQAEATTRFLQHMLASVDPSRSGRNVTVHEVLDEAAGRLSGELADQPLVRASLHHTIGNTYLSLGLYPQAEEELRRALAARRALLGDRHPDVAQVESDLASVLFATHALDEAAALLEHAAGTLRAENGEHTADLASVSSSLGAVRRAQGRLDEAETLQRETLEIRRRVLGPDSLDTAESMNNLAAVLLIQRRYDEAQPWIEEALRIRREKLGPAHPLVAQTTDNLAVVISRKGDLAAAEPLFRAALALEIQLLGQRHPDVAVTQRSLALLLVGRGELREAEELLGAALETRARVLAPTDVRRVTTALDLADVRLARGRRDAAEPLVESALDDTRALDAHSDARAAALARGIAFYEKCGATECAAALRAESADAPR
jgi:serine/threonine-protein kinase